MRRGDVGRTWGRAVAAVAVAATGVGSLVLAGAPGGAEGGEDGAEVELVDPWTARRVPLTQNLRRGVPSYPGDPVFDHEVLIDGRGHHAAGFLLEVITSLGTHTASHISAPAHFHEGTPTLDELDERFTLTPAAVIDVRDEIADRGPDFFVTLGAVQRWEAEHGRIPRGASVLLLTGAGERFDEPGGEASPYVTTPTPGFSEAAVEWMFRERGIVATGADALGPDATFDHELVASATTLARGGITIENVGERLAELRPLGDALMINCNRPEGFSGFQCGFTGLTVG